MADRVRDEFLHAWDGYKKYAWGHDELQPLSKKPHDWYGVSFCMTPVDAMDTMYLMGLKTQGDEARELVDTHLSFDQDVSVKSFEMSIRELGGLLSTYDLTGDKRLLALADDLGHRLLPMFDSPTGMPYVYVNLKTGAVSGVDSNPAEVGSYLFEFGALSKRTKNPIYYQKAKRAVIALYNRQSSLRLVGDSINIETGKWTDGTCHVGALDDAYFEYLLKCSLLFRDKDCGRMWQTSITALNKYVADETPTGLWYGEANMDTGARVGHDFGALDAYFPGTLALSGDLDRSERLEDSCYRMWCVAGIEPEVLDYSTMTITAPDYVLRPEIIESDYYLYYFTGNPRYLTMGKTFFDGIVRYCRTDAAYAALSDVRSKQQTDDMESFFLAETLKYLYLLYAPRKTLDLSKFVLNTEAHPIRKS